MKRLFRRFDSRITRQRSFEFINKSQRRARWFKLAILGSMCLAIGVVFGALPRGRYVAASVPSLATQTLRTALRIPTPRAEVDERWRRFRRQAIADARRALPAIYDDASQPFSA